MRQQTEAAVAQADVALFLIDARAGIVPLDEEIARWLRGSTTPVILVANKAEGRAAEAGIIESLALGFGDPVQVSAEHGEGMADLFEALVPFVPEPEEFEEEEDESPDAPLKLAIVGRPNAGKSTLINRMLGEDRLITGPEAGITRDSIAIDWTWDDPKNGRTSSKSFQSPTRCARSISPKSSCCCWTRPWGWRHRTSRSPIACYRKDAPWSSRSTNGTSPKTPRRCSMASRKRSRMGSAR
jgi:hypothetical protein